MVALYFVFEQQWKRQPRRKHVYALCQRTCYWEPWGEWYYYTRALDDKTLTIKLWFISINIFMFALITVSFYMTCLFQFDMLLGKLEKDGSRKVGVFISLLLNLQHYLITLSVLCHSDMDFHFLHDVLLIILFGTLCFTVRSGDFVLIFSLFSSLE